MYKKLLVLLLILLATSASAADERILADDTGYLGTSAKTLGMGRAFVAVADDVNAVFYNPAGLGQVDRFQLMTMSETSLLMGEMQYSTAALAIPIGLGTLGFGVISKRFDGIPLLSADEVDGNGRPDASLVDYGNYEDNTTLIAYGLDLGTVSQFKFFRNLSLGFTIKMYSKIGRGENDLLDDAIAQGYDLDLGLRSNLTEDFSLGFNLRNAMTYRDRYGAGALRWQTGERESIMGIYTFGGAFKMYEDQLILAADVDVFERNAKPSLGHFGLQWAVGEHMFIRTGWDQLPLPATNKSAERVANIMPAGIGLEYLGFAIDYAYYPAHNIEGTATHFLSLSFLGLPDTKTDEEEEEVTPSVPTLVSFDKLPKQMIVYKESLIIEGKAQGYEKMTIGGQEIDIKEESFSTKVPLKIGVNEIVISAKDREIKRKVLRLPTVSEGKEQALVNNLEYILIQPNFASFYKPHDKLTRRQMADWIARGKGMKMPEELKGIFTEMDLLALKGYMDESADGMFNPDELMTRGKFALALAYLEGRQDAFIGIPIENRQDYAVELLESTGQFKSTDFLPMDEVINLHDASKLMGRTSMIDLKIKNLTSGFVVPRAILTPQVLIPGEMLKVQVLVPMDVAVKKLGVRVEKNKRIRIKKISDRLFEGEWKIPAGRKAGYYPLVVLIEDVFGNKVTVKDYYEIRKTTTSEPAAVSRGVARAGVLINVGPRPLLPGKKMNIKVGLTGGQTADKVILELKNGKQLELQVNDSGLWEGTHAWSRREAHGSQLGKFYIHRYAKEPVIKEYVFTLGRGPQTLSAAVVVPEVSAKAEAPKPALLSSISGIHVLTKIKAQYVEAQTYIYAASGFTEGAEKIQSVTVVLPTNKQVALKKSSTNLWQGEVILPAKLKDLQEAKFFIKDISGRTMVQDKAFVIQQGGSQQKITLTIPVSAPAVQPLAKVKVPIVPVVPVIKPAVKAAPVKAASVPVVKSATKAAPVKTPEKEVSIKTTPAEPEVSIEVLAAEKLLQKPSRSKLNYVPDIILGPDNLRAGGILYIKTSMNTSDGIDKMTATFADGNTPLKNVGGEWRGQYKLAKGTKGLSKMKLYIKDTDGKVWAFEKLFQVN
ncbi:hypothetical protein ACFL5G_01510 [Candidatus Margulisiibacteriota bacterium]